jgi:quercetin dioxygenase-like cupin family protein
MQESRKNEIVASNREGLESRRLAETAVSETFVDLNEEVARLRGDALSRQEGGRKSKMLAKYPEFRIVLIVMPAGTRWEDHKTSARIFIQVLTGHILFHTPNGMFDLRTGQLLALDPGVIHSVDSQEESAFLLTLSDSR